MLSRIFSTDILYRWLDKVNAYVAKNSFDPVQADLTEVMAERKSIKDLLENFEEVQQELLQSARYATPDTEICSLKRISPMTGWHKFILNGIQDQLQMPVFSVLRH